MLGERVVAVNVLTGLVFEADHQILLGCLLNGRVYNQAVRLLQLLLSRLLLLLFQEIRELDDEQQQRWDDCNSDLCDLDWEQLAARRCGRQSGEFRVVEQQQNGDHLNSYHYNG